MLASASTSTCAIRLLRDHYNVQEDHIILCTLLAAPEGTKGLNNDHPNIRIVTTEIDTSLNEANYIITGLGDICFGTI